MSGTDADLAASADLLVLPEPPAHVPNAPLEHELAAAGAGTVVAIAAAPRRSTPSRPPILSARQPAYQTGIRQAAEQVRVAWC
jgi:hypothetical protein